MNKILNFKNTVLRGVVNLPTSKSISNRVLIINALSDSDMPVGNLADCDDTNSMVRVLNSDSSCFDIGHAGTAMRFLTAYLSRIVGRWEITGSERMKQRPIGVLVEALNKLGARIDYLEKNGFPPLRICGSYLGGGEIDMPASVSSQYISALLMIAPYMEKGLRLNLTGKIVSRTYIDMTLQIMRKFGAVARWEEASVVVEPVPYKPVPYDVESDWSGASYFYELLAIAGSGELQLPGLLPDSMQGDSGQAVVWEKLGVATTFKENQVILSIIPVEVSCLEYDFVGMPDIVQSFAVACCIKGIPFKFKGVETLRIKETDRIQALMDELRKMGFVLKTEGDNMLVWDGERCETGKLEIATYHDHRMAMAFAPAALAFPGLTILDAEVVTKSFPKYWEEIGHLLMY